MAPCAAVPAALTRPWAAGVENNNPRTGGYKTRHCTGMHECCRKARAVPGSAPLAHQRGYADSVSPILPRGHVPQLQDLIPTAGIQLVGLLHMPPSLLGLPRALVLVCRWHSHVSFFLSQGARPHGLNQLCDATILPQPPWPNRPCVSCTPQTAKAAFLGGGISKFRKFPQGAWLAVSWCPGEGRVSRLALQHSTDISGRGKPAAAIIYSPERALPCPQLFFLFFFFFASLNPTYSCVVCAFSGPFQPQAVPPELGAGTHLVYTVFLVLSHHGCSFKRRCVPWRGRQNALR